MKPFITLDKKAKQISFLDSRFYLIEEVYYPSVTTILSVFPKGIGFERWLKDVGNQASIIADRAAESGTRVHHALESIIAGNKVVWDGINYTKEEWLGVMAGVDFLKEFVDEIVAVESIVYHPDELYAGKVDLVVKIKGERFLIDWKFSNAIYPNHHLQVSAYKEAWDINHPDMPIDHVGILHLKSGHKGRDKSGKKCQGVNWQLVNPEDIAQYKKLSKYYEKEIHEVLYFQFLKTLQTWNFTNPERKPLNLIYPTELSVTFTKKEEKDE